MMRIAGLFLAAARGLALAPAALAQDIAVRGEQVHTMAGPAIADGVVVIDDGKIVAVGPAASTPTRPRSLRPVWSMPAPWWAWRDT